MKSTQWPQLVRRVPGLLAAVLVSAALLCAAAILVSSPAHAADKAKPDDTPKLSADAGKPLKAAQDALTKEDWAGAAQHLKEAQDLPHKTEYDEFTTNELLLFLYLHTNDYPNAEKTLEALVASQYLPKEDRPVRIRTLAQINYQLKDYDKAVQFSKQAIDSGDANEDVYTILAQSYYLKGDYKNAQQALAEHVAASIKAGQTPPEERLTLLLNSCVKLNDNDCIGHTLELLVTYYPKPTQWQNLLYTLIQTPGQNDQILLQQYRLAFDLDVLKRPEDYIEMANLASMQGSPGEAVRVLQAGQQKGVFTEAAIKSHSAQMLSTVKQKQESDLASLPKLAADADAAKSGPKYAGLGLAYYSYQQYDKAVAALSNALDKGGLRSETETRLLLGISQIHVGKKDDAIKTFQLVKGDPKAESLARLWIIRARQA
ncbi:MAG TPA: tetratricopeptide repeat protein [Steroidobacteraceae bacterium]